MQWQWSWRCLTSSWTYDLFVNVVAHKYRSSHWMEVLYVQGHLYLVCPSKSTSADRAGIEYYTSPLQHAASCSTGLQKAPLLLEEMCDRCGSTWCMGTHLCGHCFWCLMLPLTFKCDSHFCLWFCLVVWGFFLLPVVLVTFWRPVVFIYL